MTLNEQIELLRLQLVELGMKLGFNHPKVQRLSEKLDHMLNEWHKEQSINDFEQIKENSEHYFAVAL